MVAAIAIQKAIFINLKQIDANSCMHMYNDQLRHSQYQTLFCSRPIEAIKPELLSILGL